MPSTHFSTILHAGTQYPGFKYPFSQPTTTYEMQSSFSLWGVTHRAWSLSLYEITVPVAWFWLTPIFLVCPCTFSTTTFIILARGTYLEYLLTRFQTKCYKKKYYTILFLKRKIPLFFRHSYSILIITINILLFHSSEMRGLCLMKWPSVMLPSSIFAVFFRMSIFFIWCYLIFFIMKFIQQGIH